MINIRCKTHVIHVNELHDYIQIIYWKFLTVDIIANLQHSYNRNSKASNVLLMSQSVLEYHFLQDSYRLDFYHKIIFPVLHWYINFIENQLSICPRIAQTGSILSSYGRSIQLSAHILDRSSISNILHYTWFLLVNLGYNANLTRFN